MGNRIEYYLAFCFKERNHHEYFYTRTFLLKIIFIY